MRKQYPFFRDGNEQTRAVIGEEAAAADLDGEYQKPYAILSSKRLYCKNEQGNFIADGKTVRMAGREKPKRPMLALVSALLLVAILLVQLPGDYAIGVLTSRTRKDIESVQNYMDYKKLEAELSEMELPLSREELNTFLPYLDRYSDKELSDIYDACGLETLSGEGSAALDILQSAETYLEASRADTSELSEAAIEASLALLTGKFDPSLGEFLGVLLRGWYSYGYNEGLIATVCVCNLPAEGKDLLAQLCQADIETENYKRENALYPSVSFREFVDMASYGEMSSAEMELAEQYYNSGESDQEVRRQLWVAYQLWRTCGSDGYDWNALTPEQAALKEALLSRYLLRDEFSQKFGDWVKAWRSGLYVSVDLFIAYWPDIATQFDLNFNDPEPFFTVLYSASARDGATPRDLLDLLELIFTSEKYRYDPAWAWENANNYAAQLPSTEALDAISQYTQEERTTFLLPLAQAGKDGITPIRSYQEKLSRMEQNGGSARLSYRAGEMLQNIGGVETNISVLNRSLFFATLCLWVALLGAVALLLLFALNLGKLASLVGMGAGVVAAVAALFSNPAPLGYYGAPLLRFGPVVLGLAAAAVSLVVFLKLMKAAAVPTFRLITSAGTFTFREKDYPKAEREAFAAAISQGEGNA